MNRRRFLEISGTLSLASAFPWACATGSRLPNSRSLVDSSENRKAYLQQMLKMICTETGPRPAGSNAYNRAAEFVKTEMARGLPKVELDWFNFKGWRPLGDTQFTLGRESLECFAHSGA